MPAVSKAQQHAAGLALAAKAGQVKKSGLHGAAHSMMGMNKRQLSDFASGSMKKKPEHVPHKWWGGPMFGGNRNGYGGLAQFLQQFRGFGRSRGLAGQQWQHPAMRAPQESSQAGISPKLTEAKPGPGMGQGPGGPTNVPGVIGYGTEAQSNLLPVSQSPIAAQVPANPGGGSAVSSQPFQPSSSRLYDYDLNPFAPRSPGITPQQVAANPSQPTPAPWGSTGMTGVPFGTPTPGVPPTMGYADGGITGQGQTRVDANDMNLRSGLGLSNLPDEFYYQPAPFWPRDVPTPKPTDDYMQKPSPQERNLHRQNPTQFGNPIAGLLHSKVPGRTDQLPIHVASGSYVVPADVVSGIGQGNTTAGAHLLEQIFGSPKQQAMARGGSAQNNSAVPIVAAGGEYVVPPHHVTRIGGGDINKGHKTLDGMVKSVRTAVAKRMMKLPGPRTD